jgi:predicted esterase
MRSGMAGFFLGAILALLTLFIVQRLLVTPVIGEVSFHFSNCVFGEPGFPQGDVDNGRLLRRALLPVHIATTFYDRDYHEVREADHPGRYGAVVRIDTNSGVETLRFITLYRTPADIFWDVVPLPISAQLPPDLGLDPAVVRAQQHEIGEMIQDSFMDDDGNMSEPIAILLASLSETAPGDPPAVERTGAVARNEAWWYRLRQHIGLTPTYKYLIDLPQGYDADPNKRWPLILFLHGSGERGSDLGQVRTAGLAGAIARGRQLPAIVVSPQCPANESWSEQVLSHLLDEVEANHRVDPDRVYVTGTSAGGDETWDFALAHPERLAAIVPMSGETDPADAARLQHLPVWDFHGAKDDNCPAIQSIRMVEAIRRAGGHPHLTLYPDEGHQCWNRAYATEGLYTWLLAQKRAQPEVLTPGVPSDPAP